MSKILQARETDPDYRSRVTETTYRVPGKPYLLNHQIVNNEKPRRAVSVVESPDGSLDVVDCDYNPVYEGKNWQDAAAAIIEFLFGR